MQHGSSALFYSTEDAYLLLKKPLRYPKLWGYPPPSKLYSIYMQNLSKIIKNTGTYLGIIPGSFSFSFFFLRILPISAICCFDLSGKTLIFLDNLTLFAGQDAIIGILFFLLVHCSCAQ